MAPLSTSEIAQHEAIIQRELGNPFAVELHRLVVRAVRAEPGDDREREILRREIARALAAEYDANRVRHAKPDLPGDQCSREIG